MLSKTAAVKTGREVLYKAAARQAVVGRFTTGRWPRMCVKALSECCRHRAGRPSRSVGGKCVPGRDSTWVTALDFLKKTTKFLVGCEEFDAEQQEGTFLPP